MIVSFCKIPIVVEKVARDKRSNVVPKQLRNYFRHSIENRSIENKKKRPGEGNQSIWICGAIRALLTPDSLDSSGNFASVFSSSPSPKVRGNGLSNFRSLMIKLDHVFTRRFARNCKAKLV